MNTAAGSVTDFRQKILRFATMDAEERAVYSQNARAFIESGYDYAEIAKQYTAYLEQAAAQHRT